jgi:hypothetical protein
MAISRDEEEGNACKDGENACDQNKVDSPAIRNGLG